MAQTSQRVLSQTNWAFPSHGINQLPFLAPDIIMHPPPTFSPLEKCTLSTLMGIVHFPVIYIWYWDKSRLQCLFCFFVIFVMVVNFDEKSVYISYFTKIVSYRQNSGTQKRSNQSVFLTSGWNWHRCQLKEYKSLSHKAKDINKGIRVCDCYEYCVSVRDNKRN